MERVVYWPILKTPSQNIQMDALKLQWKALIFRTRITLSSAETTRDITLTDLHRFQTFPAVNIPVDVIRTNAKEWGQSQVLPFHQACPPATLQCAHTLFRIAHETFELIDTIQGVLSVMEAGAKDVKAFKKIRDGLKLTAIREWNRAIYTQSYYMGSPPPYLPIDPVTVDLFCTWTSTPHEARTLYPSFAHACSLVEMFDSIVSTVFMMNDK
jgi:hypothetical protein